MAAATSIEIEGRKELARSLRQVDKTLPKELARIHKRVATPVAKRAERNAPKGSTGRLARSVRAYGTQKAAAIGAGVRIKYAGVQNYGWPRHHIVGQHFLENALHDSEKTMLIEYEAELDEFIDSVWISII
jgi:phage gpG-like protein